jgi:hypothetical protein
VNLALDRLPNGIPPPEDIMPKLDGGCSFSSTKACVFAARKQVLFMPGGIASTTSKDAFSNDMRGNNIDDRRGKLGQRQE